MFLLLGVSGPPGGGGAGPGGGGAGGGAAAGVGHGGRAGSGRGPGGGGAGGGGAGVDCIPLQWRKPGGHGLCPAGLIGISSGLFHFLPLGLFRRMAGGGAQQH